MSRRIRPRTTKERRMNARQTTQKHATTLSGLLVRIQATVDALPKPERVEWGHAEQMATALKYAVYAAHALGTVDEDEARELGFPV